MNFKEAYIQGQKGKNKGLPMGSDLKVFNESVNGVQKKSMHVIASAPKVGKSTLIDNAYVIEPCVYVLNLNSRLDEEIRKLEQQKKGTENEEIDKRIENLRKSYVLLDIQYFSYEIDRVTKEFDLACHFMNRIYNIDKVDLPKGKTFKGNDFVPLDSLFLQGMYVYDDSKDEVIKVPEEVEKKVISVYNNWIIPLFGKFDENNEQIKKGLITFHENRDNPTGVRNTLLSHAATNGNFIYKESKTKDNRVIKRRIGYKPFDERWHCVVIMDHMRKLMQERGFDLKQTVDKMSDYFVELRNFCKFTIVPVIHLNRSMTDISRRKLDGDNIYPMDDDVKQTGNLSEDCDYLITLFNPNDDKYALTKHFGLRIKDAKNNKIYPDLRTIHLVAGRRANAPQHMRVNMLGAVKRFKKFKSKNK